ncbi:MAG: hypothetical protein SOZ79_09930 [Candidatus Ventricola sp.]|nr:hypothetical protein [Candidatus Ventricola sp.]
MRYYTVYKDDEIIAFGSSLECTEKLGLKNVRQFYALISKACSGLRRHYDIVVEETDAINHLHVYTSHAFCLK